MNHKPLATVLFLQLLLATALSSLAQEKASTPTSSSAATKPAAASANALAESKSTAEATAPRTPDRFLVIAENLRATGKYDPRNGSTFCNFYARDFAKELLGKPLPELTGQANEQITKMMASDDWEKAILVYKPTDVGKYNLKGMTAQELQVLHDSGKLIFYCWKHPQWSMELPREQRQKLHGHIAIGMPLKAGDQVLRDEIWGTKENPVAVPMTAQSGSRVFSYGKLSQGFGAARKDDILIFIYKK